MKIKKKNLKPIDIDLHFKYRCPNKKCNYYSWLSLKESQIPGFKIVCGSCNSISKPKPIQTIKIVYKKRKKSTPKENNNVNIPENLLKGGIQVLMNYGFTKKESLDLLNKGFAKNPVDNLAVLIKYILQNLEH